MFGDAASSRVSKTPRALPPLPQSQATCFSSFNSNFERQTAGDGIQLRRHEARIALNGDVLGVEELVHARSKLGKLRLKLLHLAFIPAPKVVGPVLAHLDERLAQDVRRLVPLQLLFENGDVPSVPFREDANKLESDTDSEADEEE